MRIRKTIARVAVAGVILLGGLEAALQAGHALAERRALRGALSEPGSPVIVCLGDSHTYGAGVESGEAYPAQLEKQLRAGGRRVNVVNLGAPGTNTSEVRRRLPDILEYYNPVAVIVLAGVNNGWNRRDAAWSDREDGLPTAAGARAREFLATRVRLIRAVIIVLHRLDWAGAPEELARDRNGNVVVHAKENDDRREPAPAVYDRARRDLTAIVAQTRAAHAVPVLMTYVTDPVYDFEAPNRLLREVAAALNVPLADNDLALRPLLSNPDGALNPAMRESMFFPDMHPRAPAYQKIADNVAQTLDAAGARDRLPH